MKRKDTVFTEFEDISPKKKQPSIQALYEYEKHYMNLLKDYHEEISFIEQLMKDFRDEQITFFDKIIPEINKKLDNEHIDPEMKKVWLNRLLLNIDRSFSLSETLISDYAIKKIDDFKKAINEKLRNI